MLCIYRACSTGNPHKDRPIEGKYNLVKYCFKSFLKAFEGVEYKLIVLLDKPNPQFRRLFRGHEVIESFHGDFNEGNIKSFHKQIDLALEHKDSFFFIEDDYYFLPNAGRVLSNVSLPFWTPYDHPGYYTEDTHRYDREVLIDGWHWQSIISTTLTFGGTFEALEQELNTMKRYGWADHPMWCDITQRVKLYAPIPSLATHMETEHLANLIKWPFLQTSHG